ncbi:MAG: hypothetical protein C4582_05025 [Desulfobacteraceae bacterium]|nr:MAG: hypothetical protein C4582_05025 [Desulfobacteraceae bacterium]
MDRRKFIKAVILTVPALFIRPLPMLDAIGRIGEKRLPTPDFVIFFIGDYGKALSGNFRTLKAESPVIRRCDHIRMDVNSDDGFVELKTSGEAMEALPRLSGVKLAVFVVDMAMPEDLALARFLAGALRADESRFVAITPARFGIEESCPFDLVFETQTHQGDAALSFLLTLHNTYLGCGGMGSIMCMKYFLDYFLVVMRFRCGRVVSTMRTNLQGKEGRLRADTARVIEGFLALSQGISSGPVWAIIETPFQGIDPFMVHEVASEELMRRFTECTGCLVHPGFGKNILKFTLIDWG